MTDPIARMHDAQRLLEDPLLKEAFTQVENSILATLKGPATDRDGELLMALRLLPKIKGWIKGQVETGKVELFDREQKEKK